jgi:hypothetical protein
MTTLKKIVIEVDGKEVELSTGDAEQLYELLRLLLGKVELAPVVVYQPVPYYVPPPTYPQPYVPYDPGPVYPNPTWPNWQITC